MKDVLPDTRQWGMLAPTAIFWLVASEKEVWQQVVNFIYDQAPNRLDVAGAPTIEAVLRQKAYPKEAIELPTVRLHMKKVKHHLTGQSMVEITCTDAHLVDIESWRTLANFKFNELRPDEIKLERKPLN